MTFNVDDDDDDDDWPNQNIHFWSVHLCFNSFYDCLCFFFPKDPNVFPVPTQWSSSTLILYY